MRKWILSSVILIGVSILFLCACGDNSSKTADSSGNNNGLTTGGDLIAESQKTRQELREGISKAQAILNAPPVEKRTSDQVMGKEEEYFVPDYASMTDGSGGSEDVNEGEEWLSNLNENEERRRNTPIDIKAKENTVLLDEDDVKITYKGLDADFLGDTIRLKLLIENNTPGAKMVQIRDESINGYMCEGSFSPEINAGMKANDDIAFYNLPEEVGIDSKGEIKNITFAFCIFNADKASESKIYNPINLQF